MVLKNLRKKKDLMGWIEWLLKLFKKNTVHTKLKNKFKKKAVILELEIFKK